MSNAPLSSEQPDEPVGSTNPGSDSIEHTAPPELGSMNPGSSNDDHFEREVGSSNPAADAYPEGYGSANPGPAENAERPGQFSRPDDAFMTPARPKRGWTLVAAALVGALVVGGASGGVVAAINDNAPSSTTNSAVSNGNNDAGIKSVNERTASNLADVVKASAPSVVTIGVNLSDGSGGTGSGIVLNANGYIVTNAHVATLEGESAAGNLAVQTSTGDVYSAKLVGYDATADTAVLKVSDQAKGIKPITFANSDQVQVGQATIAIGSPLGLAGTVTSGIVSAINRPISVPSSEVGQSSSSSDSVSLNAIQTDAAINSGNSGGALLNAAGDLIGMNDAIATSGQSSGSIGIGFSIPSNYVKRVAQEIIATGKATHGRLGASVGNASDSSGSSFGFGAVIRSVERGSAADDAGLKANDVITKMGSTVISDATQLTALVRQQAPGSVVKITFKRGSDTASVDVKLEKAS